MCAACYSIPTNLYLWISGVREPAYKTDEQPILPHKMMRLLMPNRRGFAATFCQGLGSVAMLSLLQKEGIAADSSAATTDRGRRGRVQRVVQLFMSGAASQCDTFDYKPRLLREHGNAWDPGERVELFQSNPGTTLRSPWPWRQYGQCGKWINDCVAPLGRCVDDIAFVHNMTSKSNVHGPATFMQATGFVLPGFPSVGAWVSYGLGNLTENLPTFVVLPDPRGVPPNGARNWAAAFLPANHQGTVIQPNATNPIADLFPSNQSYVTNASERDSLASLNRINQMHRSMRAEDTRLDARIRSYELAARMQLSAPEVLDISDEPRYIRDLYGLDCPNDNSVDSATPMNAGEETRLFGKNCLVARRLLERGVRFIQIWSGADNGFPRRNWDSHEDLSRDHWPLGRGMAHGAAALILDLKQRGMLEDTLILWTTEFGRMPCSQGKLGRDHNPFVFTNWLAGGGIRGGTSFGASDEWSFKPENPESPTYCYDIHATLLHLLGIDHRALTVRHNGIDRRLTDVHGSVIHEILA
jgi:hypothetical protein